MDVGGKREKWMFLSEGGGLFFGELLELDRKSEGLVRIYGFEVFGGI